MITHHSKVNIFISKDLGNKSQAPFLFLHGFTGSSKSWIEIINNIDHPYILIDLPGHSKSLFNNNNLIYTFNEWADDLKNILNQIEIYNIKLCGYSMGGRLAIAFANKYPILVKEIFIESAHLGIENINDKENRLRDDISLTNKIKNNFNLFLSNWEKLDMFKMQQYRNLKSWKVQKSIRKSQIPDQLCMALNSFSLGKMPGYYNYISQATIPIHIINGIDDVEYIKHTKSLYRLNKNIYHHIIDNSSHNVHLENPMDYIKILKKSNRYDL